MVQDFEKLGSFYLGRTYDLAAKKLQEDLLLYDARDLVTHAVVIGMTGSGKTGLCIDLIEEAAIDGIPSILIDPKGDLTNLLLTFPQLSGEDFLPWVNPEDASRKGLSVQDFANQQAAMWQKGLADWGQDKERVQRLRDAADFAVYTPGSSAGIPVSILKSFAAPADEVLEDGELFQEKITTLVSSLLGLLKIEADPLQSREHILLSTLIGQTWRQGQDLDLAALISQIQNPPITKIGVLDLETFYPSKDRFGLVMALNNLLASPGFSAWLEGAPLEIDQILHTPQGKPRVAIFSVAHLGDSERMFFVSMLLNQILGWMRTQPGTTSLRALVYMDEIFGYFPPVSNPPSKKPLLTLLKQARAFGVGLVLATQNPVDLDYKGLANSGTWFIGRLQTERDKERVMDGLEGASASGGGAFDRQQMDQLLSGLGSRVFLMNNTHEDAPVVFQTRWTLSYLRGPLTRSQIKQLMESYKKASVEAVVEKSPAGKAPVSTTAAPAAPVVEEKTASSVRPALPPEIPQYFIPLRGSASDVFYKPVLIGAARVRFADLKTRIDTTRDCVCITPVVERVVPVDWQEAEAFALGAQDLEKSPAEGVQFTELPSAAFKAKNYAAWSRDFTAWVYGGQKLEVLRSPSTGLLANPDEPERDFRIRLQQVVREQRDQAVELLRKKYTPKITALQEKIRRAQQVVEKETAQAQQAGLQTALSFGATLLGAFTGRKTGASSAVRNVGRTFEQSGDIGRAKESLQVLQQQLEELNTQFKQEAEALAGKMDPSEALEKVSIAPKKTDISVQLVALAWAPYRQDKPAW